MAKTCKKCGSDKDIAEFSKSSPNWCRSCYNERARSYRTTPEAKQRIKAYRRPYRDRTEYNKVYWQRLKSQPDFKTKHSMKWRLYRDGLWEEFLAAYGSSCYGTSNGEACPNNEANTDRLTLAHLFNNGAEHRKRIGLYTRTMGLILDLKRREWPTDEGIGVQCGSCQLQDLRELMRNGNRTKTRVA